MDVVACSFDYRTPAPAAELQVVLDPTVLGPAWPPEDLDINPDTALQLLDTDALRSLLNGTAMTAAGLARSAYEPAGTPLRVAVGCADGKWRSRAFVLLLSRTLRERYGLRVRTRHHSGSAA